MTQEQAFYSWSNSKGLEKALSQYSHSIEAFGADTSDNRAFFTADRTFVGVDNNLSIKSEYNRRDYEARRTSEKVPKNIKDIIAMSMVAYQKVSIVRNIIDLMSDFGSQGIRLVHPNPKIEKFHERWFEKIRGKERSERFLNYFYRTGNVIVRRINGKIPINVEREFKRIKGDFELTKVEKRKIPIRYVFHNPLTLNIVGGEQLGAFIGKHLFQLKFSNKLLQDLRKVFKNQRKIPKQLRDLLKEIPPDVRNLIERKQPVILNPNNIRTFYYRKDDWDAWARPLVSAILDDLVILEKLKLADVSALDGAISNIRLWKLGDLEHKILPTPSAINKLRNILTNGLGGGTMDLVWGPELSFSESKTDLHQFLGSEKYEQHMNTIYDGLGVPPTLTASNSSGGSTGFTNNFISLKTLIERLEYGRDALVSFWKGELKRVQKSMGFRFPAVPVFDKAILSDEAAMKRLAIELADRNIISDRTLREHFGLMPDEIETVRIKRENREKENGKTPLKAGPFHNPDVENDFRKLILQKGGALPDLENNDLFKGVFEKFKPTSEQSPEGGRPKNSRDTGPRKQKRVVPKTSAEEFANLFIWYHNAQNQLHEMITPGLFKIYGKKNLRQFSRKESEQAEYIQFAIMSRLQPFRDISKEKVYNHLKQSISVSDDVLAMAKTLSFQFREKNLRKPNLSERKQIQISACVLSRCELEE